MYGEAALRPCGPLKADNMCESNDWEVAYWASVSHSRLRRAAPVPDRGCLIFALVVRRDGGVMNINEPRQITGRCNPLAQVMQHAHFLNNAP